MLPVAAAGLGLVALAASPAIEAITRQLRNRTPKDNFYSDVDGTSTPEAIASFSTKLPKSIILALSTLGSGTSIATSILCTLGNHSQDSLVENWLTTASWAFISLHAICLGAHHSSVKSHDLGLWLLSSCFVVAAITILQLVQVSVIADHLLEPVIILRAVNIVIIIALGFSSLLLPRRPDVFYKGRKVDAQWTVSALNRYTWAWIRPILDHATQKYDLDTSDLPDPDHRVRTELLKEKWEKCNFKGSLLRSLILFYKAQFIVQWSLTLFRCCISIMPYWIMLRIIKILEVRGSNGTPTLELWSLVFWLGAFTLVDQVRYCLTFETQFHQTDISAVD